MVDSGMGLPVGVVLLGTRGGICSHTHSNRLSHLVVYWGCHRSGSSLVIVMVVQGFLPLRI